ncbi:HNH endonuclease signature motif containing protein [Knoellia sp. CPCC 206435]|uniref:HNH endonuclease signature motif containing protein n=1 Tax=Knoellia terrae TaxID=3404797 RepID=UPI003B433B2E
MARRIKEMALATDHFTRRRGRTAPNRLTPDQVFTPIPVGSPRRKPHQLKRALLAIGRTWECELCDNDGTWCGQRLTLHVDHIDGDFHNNVPTNLRFLCPNCHSPTPNFAGKSKGRKAGAPSRTATI